MKSNPLGTIYSDSNYDQNYATVVLESISTLETTQNIFLKQNIQYINQALLTNQFITILNNIYNSQNIYPAMDLINNLNNYAINHNQDLNQCNNPYLFLHHFLNLLEEEYRKAFGTKVNLNQEFPAIDNAINLVNQIYQSQNFSFILKNYFFSIIMSNNCNSCKSTIIKPAFKKTIDLNVDSYIQQNQGSPFSLDECLQNYFSLRSTTCQKCKQSNVFQTRVILKSGPVLIINLMRNNYTGDKDPNFKINLNIDISQYKKDKNDGNNNYTLKSCISFSQLGFFTDCLVKRENMEGEWYRYMKKQQIAISQEKLFDFQPILLFYECCNNQNNINNTNLNINQNINYQNQNNLQNNQNNIQINQNMQQNIQNNLQNNQNYMSNLNINQNMNINVPNNRINDDIDEKIFDIISNFPLNLRILLMEQIHNFEFNLGSNINNNNNNNNQSNFTVNNNGMEFQSQFNQQSNFQNQFNPNNQNSNFMNTNNDIYDQINNMNQNLNNNFEQNMSQMNQNNAQNMNNNQINQNLNKENYQSLSNPFFNQNPNQINDQNMNQNNNNINVNVNNQNNLNQNNQNNESNMNINPKKEITTEIAKNINPKININDNLVNNNDNLSLPSYNNMGNNMGNIQNQNQNINLEENKNNQVELERHLGRNVNDNNQNQIQNNQNVNVNLNENMNKNNELNQRIQPNLQQNNIIPNNINPNVLNNNINIQNQMPSSNAPQFTNKDNNMTDIDNSSQSSPNINDQNKNKINNEIPKQLQNQAKKPINTNQNNLNKIPQKAPNKINPVKKEEPKPINKAQPKPEPKKEEKDPNQYPAGRRMSMQERIKLMQGGIKLNPAPKPAAPQKKLSKEAIANKFQNNAPKNDQKPMPMGGGFKDKMKNMQEMFAKKGGFGAPRPSAQLMGMPHGLANMMINNNDNNKGGQKPVVEEREDLEKKLNNIAVQKFKKKKSRVVFNPDNE